MSQCIAAIAAQKLDRKTGEPIQGTFDTVQCKGDAVQGGELCQAHAADGVGWVPFLAPAKGKADK